MSFLDCRGKGWLCRRRKGESSWQYQRQIPPTAVATENVEEPNKIGNRSATCSPFCPSLQCVRITHHRENLFLPKARKERKSLGPQIMESRTEANKENQETRKIEKSLRSLRFLLSAFPEASFPCLRKSACSAGKSRFGCYSHGCICRGSRDFRGEDWEHHDMLPKMAARRCRNPPAGRPRYAAPAVPAAGSRGFPAPCCFRRRFYLVAASCARVDLGAKMGLGRRRCFGYNLSDCTKQREKEDEY